MAELSKKINSGFSRFCESRHGDLREQNLNRQGKGHFHVSGMGHEALARDRRCDGRRRLHRAAIIATAAWSSAAASTSRELALDYFAKRKGQSHGRQMPSHYSYARTNIWSVPTPTGSQLLPACGIAWGIQLDAKPNFVVTTIGDAATRQGDFFEAICFAKERQAAGAVRGRGQRLRHQQPDAEDQSARARCSSA